MKLIATNPGARIAELRRAAGLDQRGLGVAAGLYRGAIEAAREDREIPPPSTEESFAAGDLIDAIETGPRVPSPVHLALIAAALGVEPLDLTQQVVDLTPEEAATRLAEIDAANTPEAIAERERRDAAAKFDPALVVERLVAALLGADGPKRADLPADQIDAINARRAGRGEPAI